MENYINNHPDGTRLYCFSPADTNVVADYPLAASPYGAYGMAGNIWEWVNDWYNSNLLSYLPCQQSTRSSFKIEKVLWDGSWRSTGVASRNFENDEGFQYGSLGFRGAAAP
ncbi:MAG: SUMF1/EgtB/PvdO family nonheme iron enzyme [Anaerolineales bacterium]|nr:SUMF1/EgtB/PvdO family nonheme iron enzyme [Anaerolineales bacterium]